MDNKGIEGNVEHHFGKAATYTINDTDTGDLYVIANESDHMGGISPPPEFLHEKGVEIMLCAGLGNKALQMFESYGIQVFIGAKGTVKETLNAWENGLLKIATVKDACADHGHEHNH